MQLLRLDTSTLRPGPELSELRKNHLLAGGSTALFVLWDAVAIERGDPGHDSRTASRARTGEDARS